MKTKNYFSCKTSVMLSFVFLLFLTSCGALMTPPPPQERLEVKNFDWTPPTKAIAKLADLSVILLRPIYADKFEDAKISIYQKFSKNMGIDFEEMLVAKGYTIRGPYDTYNEIVFSDKSETDLMLEVEIDFTSEWANGISIRKTTDALAAAMGKASYKYWIDGELFMGGKINLVLKESITKEKLWIKSLKLSDKSVKIVTNKITASDDKSAINLLANSAGYLNPLSSLLDEYYQQALTTAWNQLEPQELRALKKQVKELRSKKGY